MSQRQVFSTIFVTLFVALMGWLLLIIKPGRMLMTHSPIDTTGSQACPLSQNGINMRLGDERQYPCRMMSADRSPWLRL
jgi:hypothetical protein